MTCKPTMAKLLEEKRLRSVTLGLHEDELPKRGLFGTERFFDDLAEKLPKILSGDATLSALEQVAILFGRYLLDRPIKLYASFTPLKHLENAVWEFKTNDVRVFGWAAHTDCVIVDSLCDVKLLKSEHLNYSGFITQTSSVRTRLGFKSTEYLHGTEPQDILTNVVILNPTKRSPPRRRG